VQGRGLVRGLRLRGWRTSGPTPASGRPALVCGETWAYEKLFCVALQASVASVSKKADYNLLDNAGGFAILGLGNGKASLCYEQKTGGNHMNAMCSVLTIGANAVTAGPQLMIVQGEIPTDVDMMRVSDGFIICYDYSTGIYLGDPGHTKCDLIKTLAGDALRTTAPVLMASAGHGLRRLSAELAALLALAGAMVARWLQ